ncbi:uncharacterized protein LOC131604357 [Vicia villosa]|uniref:uncharacterized protein LOC131604357 n=1 Tax=Vicia villosa TaxID=3911 RepID=UPI00273C0088|nr:uncharacterized protein LOC131604357 [Vicia villosa]
MNNVKQFMMKNWNTVQLPDLLYHDDGYFLMKFKSSKEKEEILMNGPYMIKNMPMILRDWKPNFSMKKDMLRTIPLWMKLPQLPLEYWGANSLKKIGSAIGRPVVTDECTAHKLRVSYARILVEIDATQEVPKVVMIQNSEGELVSQDVEYEWLPKLCGKCQRFGHNCATKKTITHWKPKEPVAAQGTQPAPSIEKVAQSAPTLDLQKDKTFEQVLEDGSKLNEGSSKKDEGNWSSPKGGSKGRSTIRYSCSQGTPNFASNNGFDALGDLIEPSMHIEPGPCKSHGMLGGSIKVSYDRYLDNYSHHPNGRIWVSWKSSHNDISLIASTDQMLHYSMKDIQGDLKFHMTVVYAMNTLANRRCLWNDIEKLNNNNNAPWCVVGDFNNALRSKDQIGGRLVTESEFIDLQSMMDRCNLAEMENKGDYYTWHNKHELDPIYSRIDRVLGNPVWFLHMDLNGFHELVVKSWTEPMSGSPPFVLWEKLKRLRPILRNLSKPLTDIQRHILTTRMELNNCQQELSKDLTNASLIHEVKDKTMEIIKWQELEEKVLHQKAKIDWIKLGDGNNQFFHASLKAKANSNKIMKVCLADGTEVTDKQGMHDRVLGFYGDLMGKEGRSLSQINLQVMREGNCLNNEQRQDIIKSISEKEIFDALHDMGDSKSPGMDGYSAKFFKSCWSIVKEDLICTIRYWFRTNTMFKGFNSTLVTLIPKFPEAKQLKDYRTIACCTIVYKIYSKILTSRMAKVIGTIVSKHQAAFIPGQHIHKHILLAYELIKGYSRKHGTPRNLIQQDLQKAYDMLNWQALKTILAELGFPNQLLLKMQENLIFKHHPKCKKLGLTHLIFADDILLFSKGDVASIQMLMNTLQVFSNSIGLIVNPSKCFVYMGAVDDSTKEQILSTTGFNLGQLPFRYLGVPLSSKKLSIAYYLPLMDRILKRIHHWSSKLLSFAGRVQLVKAISFAITSYWLQCFPIPKCVIKRINVACRTFIWTGGNMPSRKSPIAWKEVCKPREKGGLNIIDLEDWNKVTMLKLLWDLRKKTDSLWVLWMHTYYIREKDIMIMELKHDSSWIVKGILKARMLVPEVLNTWHQALSASSFKMGKFYKDLNRNHTTVSWSVLFAGNIARPRALFCLWLACHKRLATRERLAKLGFINVTNCCFCNHNESIEHLFYGCSTMKNIWTEILDWIQTSHTPLEWPQELHWLTRSGKGKGIKAGILKLAVAECLYQCWRLRNDVCFGNAQNIDKVVHNIKEAVIHREWSYRKYKEFIARNLML